LALPIFILYSSNRPPTISNLFSYTTLFRSQIDSTEIYFSQSKGKVAMVNFWATWCPPCVAEMPSFQKLYDAYGDKVDFYFVTSRSEEHTSELQSRENLVCRLLLEKKKKKII